MWYDSNFDIISIFLQVRSEVNKPKHCLFLKYLLVRFIFSCFFYFPNNLQ